MPQKNNDDEIFLIGWMSQKIMIKRIFLIGGCRKKIMIIYQSTDKCDSRGGIVSISLNAGVVRCRKKKNDDEIFFDRWMLKK